MATRRRKIPKTKSLFDLRKTPRMKTLFDLRLDEDAQGPPPEADPAETIRWLKSIDPARRKSKK